MDRGIFNCAVDSNLFNAVPILHSHDWRGHGLLSVVPVHFSGARQGSEPCGALPFAALPLKARPECWALRRRERLL